MKEINYIVRVAGKDLDGTKPVEYAIQGLKGVGPRIAEVLSSKFIKEIKITRRTKLGELSAEEVTKLEELILNPEKHGVPIWAMNRRKDIETGKNKHLIMNELAFSLKKDFERMGEIKSYKGLRHISGLTVRGQKTKSRHRGKGGSVGVSKKDANKPAKKAAAPAKAPATKKK
ncbi:MAG: 30S ribosomal protein S13 [Candidatus Diapherotrites archaeon]|jgi:small subunit ribosomal protein S13|uniref:Small ribosomal subunit protein uS13 n=1 Tax=Candidatus Iainarchaeum sp. TaxID=3101447 RepID=A0A7K4BYA6_9ARCH|nr:30S ribosomal protein S13 [Candidatus Diapherotrites archaeon]